METLASAMRRDNRRFKPPSSSSAGAASAGRVPLVMAFLACLACVYVAGRLWQDAQTRAILSGLLEKSTGNLPKEISVDDKLRDLGCTGIGRKIAEAEMDIAKAKSEGYLWGNGTGGTGTEGSDRKKFLAVIGVYTGFGSRLKRNIFRGSWMPRGDALKKLEEKGVVIRFVIGRSPNRGDSLDRNINEESKKTNDFLILESHEEAAEELPKKVKFFFGAAIEAWHAEFYVKVDDNIHLDLAGLIEMLASRRGSHGLYMGCMKSGAVVSEEEQQWYEPEWWKFGESRTYFRHASGSLFILSNNLARYININSASLQSYAHDDISVGSWMMGLNATYVDDDRLCCLSSVQEKVCSIG